jgi:hypothetical protein
MFPLPMICFWLPAFRFLTIAGAMVLPAQSKTDTVVKPVCVSEKETATLFPLMTGLISNPFCILPFFAPDRTGVALLSVNCIQSKFQLPVIKASLTTCNPVSSATESMFLRKGYRPIDNHDKSRSRHIKFLSARYFSMSLNTSFRSLSDISSSFSTMVHSSEFLSFRPRLSLPDGWYKASVLVPSDSATCGIKELGGNR